MACNCNEFLTGAFRYASDILGGIFRAIASSRRRWSFAQMRAADEVHCDCGAPISLRGLWRCGCGYTYRGHLLTRCPICRTIPRVARCYQCGVTVLLPEGEP